MTAKRTRWNSTLPAPTKPLPRGKPTKRGGPIRSSRVPIPRSPIKPSRGKPRRFAHRRDAGYCAWIRTLSCEAKYGAWIDGCTPCSGRIECAHVKTRSTGGDDRGNTLPLCTRHHREQHAIGLRSFERKYEIDMLAIATKLELAYDPEEPPVW